MNSVENGIKILITGDFYGGNRIDKLIQQDRFAEIFNDFLPHISQADIAITNLESPLTHSIRSISKTGPAIKSNPKAIEALKFAGFNMVTLANNHIMDYGKEGLKDTMDLCSKNKIDIVGAGMNYQEASKTVFKEVGELKIAFVNFAENEWSTTTDENAGAHPLNPIANYYKIREAKNLADFVFVIVHGGHEMYNLPSPRMKETYRFFIDAGADTVVGHHTHCYSGYEVYKNKSIFYSLGNFIFDKNLGSNPLWEIGYALKFNIQDNHLDFEIIPYRQNGNKAGLQILSSDFNKEINSQIDKLNELIQDDRKLKTEFELFCNKNRKIYNYYLEPHSNRYLYALQSRNIIPSFLNKRKKILYKNLVSCEAHRDFLIQILKT